MKRSPSFTIAKCAKYLTQLTCKFVRDFMALTVAVGSAHAATPATNSATPNGPVPQVTTDASLPVALTASIALAQLATEDANSATPNTERASAISAAPAGSTATASPVPVDAGPQRWNAHIQSTYIFQTKDPMHAPYTGPNSLLQDREYGWSWSVTAGFGLRLWPGAELYFDPEMVAARAISHASGLGGLADGEISKTADPNPTTYYARLFLRQTWDLGGDHTHVDSAINQLAGSVASRRIVLTVGDYSPTDIFGQNSYAGDPRTQFLNAAAMNYGAWDYPSDSRGYTWGAALEYYRDAWAFRIGRFLQPRDPNGLQLNYRPFEDYGDAAEVEHEPHHCGTPR
ncbi:hypothetical protein OKW49_008108 [Paraburkholderia youngii]|uniref:hypothetical protein n=1 Tax=Paraburkholderia youngii TaxID=2782701 RepID=UPI003D1B28BD